MVTDRPALNARPAQRQVRAFPGDGFPLAEVSDGIDELGQALRAFPGCRPVPPDVLPLARRMPGADARRHRAWSEDVKRGGIRRHVHGRDPSQLRSPVCGIRAGNDSARRPVSEHARAY
jgi:hypothetical protein